MTVDDLDHVEKRLILNKQQRCLSQVYQRLYEGKPLNKSNCPLPILRGTPALVDDIIRMVGRLAKALVVFGTRCPILLPYDSTLSELIIDKYHKGCRQGSTNYTFSSLRERFWLQNGSSFIRKVIKSCLNCKKTNATFEQQMMADLPAARLQIFDPPFTHASVDYFGPFHGKQGRSTVKRYGCVFTCMTTRAVHIEMAADMTTDCFLNASRRFISQRKGVKHLYSDNGSNFTGVERVLQQDLNNLTRLKYTKSHKVSAYNGHSIRLLPVILEERGRE